MEIFVIIGSGRSLVIKEGEGEVVNIIPQRYKFSQQWEKYNSYLYALLK